MELLQLQNVLMGALEFQQPLLSPAFTQTDSRKSGGERQKPRGAQPSTCCADHRGGPQFP